MLHHFCCEVFHHRHVRLLLSGGLVLLLLVHKRRRMKLDKLHILHPSFGTCIPLPHRPLLQLKDCHCRTIYLPITTRSQQCCFVKYLLDLVCFQVRYIYAIAFYIGCSFVHQVNKVVLRDNIHHKTMLDEFNVLFVLPQHQSVPFPISFPVTSLWWNSILNDRLLYLFYNLRPLLYQTGRPIQWFRLHVPALPLLRSPPLFHCRVRHLQ